MLFYFLSVDRGDADGRRIIVPALVDLDVPVDPGTQLLSATPAGTSFFLLKVISQDAAPSARAKRPKIKVKRLISFRKQSCKGNK